MYWAGARIPTQGWGNLRGVPCNASFRQISLTACLFLSRFVFLPVVFVLFFDVFYYKRRLYKCHSEQYFNAIVRRMKCRVVGLLSRLRDFNLTTRSSAAVIRTRHLFVTFL